MKLFASLTLAFSLLAASGSAQSVISGAGCGGFSIGFTGTPTNGTTYTVTCTGGIPGSASAIFIGAAAATPLPLDSLGATGCTLYIDTLAFFAVPTPNLDGAGGSLLALPLAADPGTIGVSFSNQFAFLDFTLTVNPLGAALSDMLTATIQ